jgi:hypothetical protein
MLVGACREPGFSFLGSKIRKWLGVLPEPLDMKYSSGTVPLDKLMRSMVLYSTKVMPRCARCWREACPIMQRIAR